jgi:hypothetical protein
MKVLNNPGARKSKRNTGPNWSNHAVPEVPSRKARMSMAVLGRVLALAAMMAIVITGTTTAASAATINRTCQARAEGIDTCEWMVTSLKYIPPLGRDDTQIVTYAEMEGGTANREIIQIQLQWRWCNYYGCGIFNADESSIDLVGGTYTVSFHIGPVLCNYPIYRPIFQWKIYEGKQAGWVYGWSYGNWLIGHISPCTSS